MNISREIFYTEFGSFVYGTNVPSSDRDYKGIFVPCARDILLQRATATSVNKSTKEDPTAKNSAQDIDIERFTLQSFIRLCAEGQTVAMDLLFTPKKFWVQSSPEWDYIQTNRPRLVHSGVSSFIGYATQQAAKYGIKGSRVAAVRAVLELLAQFDPQEKISKYADSFKVIIFGHELFDPNPAVTEHVSIVMCRSPNGKEEPHLQVCNRKVSFHSRVKYAREIFQKIFDQYGQRALAAEKNEGVDWKAVMHAVRVCGQAKELLSTGQVTFPRPEKERLLKIRKAEIPYQEVATEIEKGLEDLKQIQTKSQLPKQIDVTAWENWICEVYEKEIKGEPRSTD